jgi:hypothetical protein
MAMTFPYRFRTASKILDGFFNFLIYQDLVQKVVGAGAALSRLHKAGIELDRNKTRHTRPRMMYDEFTHRRRYLRREFLDALFLRSVRQNNQLVVVHPRSNVTGASETSPNCLSDATQTGIRRVSAENVAVRVEIVD